MMDYIGIPPLIVLAVLSLLGIFSRSFDDNLLQRIGLCGVCFGAVMRLATTYLGADLSVPRLILVYGAAIFAIGVAYKFWRIAHGDKP